MEKAPGGTSVGVEDPYDHVDRCDFVTGEGKCRWAREHGHHDPDFANARSAEEYRCPAAVGPDGDSREMPYVSERESGESEAQGASNANGEGPAVPRAVGRDAPDDGGSREHGDPRTDDAEWDWRDCPHFRCQHRDRECQRCGLEERRQAHDDSRPLLEEHHLSYADGDDLSHEITVYLCRWCHAKVHNSWARIDDDASPDPEAIAQQEGRRSEERAELDFQSASDRYRQNSDDK